MLRRAAWARLASSLSNGLVETYASKPVASITSDSSITEAMEMMISQRMGALAVMDNGALSGLITERDFLNKIALDGSRYDMYKPCVADLMTPASNLTSASKADTLGESLATMRTFIARARTHGTRPSASPPGPDT